MIVPVCDRVQRFTIGMGINRDRETGVILIKER